MLAALAEVDERRRAFERRRQARSTSPAGLDDSGSGGEAAGGAPWPRHMAVRRRTRPAPRRQCDGLPRAAAAGINRAPRPPPVAPLPSHAAALLDLPEAGLLLDPQSSGYSGSWNIAAGRGAVGSAAGGGASGSASGDGASGPAAPEGSGESASGTSGSGSESSSGSGSEDEQPGPGGALGAGIDDEPATPRSPSPASVRTSAPLSACSNFSPDQGAV